MNGLTFLGLAALVPTWLLIYGLHEREAGR
ncbi:hypothetical protein TSOC111612_11930 [Tsukamurella ocularis]